MTVILLIRIEHTPMTARLLPPRHDRVHAGTRGCAAFGDTRRDGKEDDARLALVRLAFTD